jgi:hypothetical protein
MVYAAKMIGVRKLALITLTIVSNALAVLGLVLLICGILMTSTSAFHAAVDLSVSRMTYSGCCCSNSCTW